MPSPSPDSQTKSRTPSPSLWLVVFSFVGTFLSAGVIWGTRLPLGIPGEWTWNREPLPPDFWWNLPLLAIVVALTALWIAWSYVAIGSATLRTLVGMLCITAGFAFVWLWTLQEAAPGEMRLSKGIFVLYYPGPSGYFTEARYQVSDLREYLARYEGKLREGDVLHIGTHPPGLIVGYRILMSARQSAPWFFDLLDSLQPASFRDASRVLINLSRRGDKIVTPADISILWAAQLCMLSGAAFTVVPLFFLIAEFFSRRTAWLLIHFWPFVPALSLFLPKSDAFFPFLSSVILALWICGWRRGSFSLCAAAGLAAFSGLFLSLAFLPVFFLAALLTFWISSPWIASTEQTPLSFSRVLTCGAGVLLGFSAPVLFIRLWSGMNLLTVWWLNYGNHAGFYRQYTRTYSQWIWYNPLELAVALGIPLFVLATTSVVRSLRIPRTNQFGIALGIVLTWSILWLSGKNMGEAARLWLFLMPWGVWLSAPALEPLLSSSEDSLPPRTFWLLWGTQVLASFVVASRVVGFNLSGA